MNSAINQSHSLLHGAGKTRRDPTEREHLPVARHMASWLPVESERQEEIKYSYTSHQLAPLVLLHLCQPLRTSHTIRTISCCRRHYDLSSIVESPMSVANIWTQKMRRKNTGRLNDIIFETNIEIFKIKVCLGKQIDSVLVCEKLPKKGINSKEIAIDCFARSERRVVLA